MIYELAQNFHAAVAAIPQEHPKRRMLELLEEAIRRDIHFTDRHPTTLFQCMWNTCWWYDCPEAAKHYEEPEGGWRRRPPWENADSKLSGLLEHWRSCKTSSVREFTWVQYLRPPAVRLGSGVVGFLQGHEGRVNSLAFALSGSCLVSGSDDGTTRVWDVASGRELSREANGGEKVTAIAATPDASLIVAGCEDGTLHFFQGRSLMRRATISVHHSPVACIAVSSDGRRVVSAGRDGFLLLTSEFPHLRTEQLPDHSLPVTALDCASDGRLLAGGSKEGSVRLWDLSTKRIIATHVGSGTAVTDVVFAPHPRGLAVAYADGAIRRLNVHVGPIAEANPTSILRRLFYGTTRHISRGTRIQLPRDTRRIRQAVTSIAMSSDGKRMAIATGVSTVHAWDTVRGVQVAQVEQTRRDQDLMGFVDIAELDITPDGRLIASSGSDGVIYVYDWKGLADDWGEEAEETRWSLMEWDVVFSADGKHLVTSGGFSDNLWRIGDSAVLVSSLSQDVYRRKFCFSRDGDMVVAKATTGKTRCWDVNNGRERSTEGLDQQSLVGTKVPEAQGRYEVLSRKGESSIVDGQRNRIATWVPWTMGKTVIDPSGLVFALMIGAELVVMRVRQS